MKVKGMIGPLGLDACTELGAIPVHATTRPAMPADMVSAATVVRAQVQTMRVVRVIGGDTVVGLTVGSLNLKVRLQGIDALECGMPFGREARQFLEQLVLGRAVQMAATGLDRYGRTVAPWRWAGNESGSRCLRPGWVGMASAISGFDLQVLQVAMTKIGKVPS